MRGMHLVQKGNDAVVRFGIVILIRNCGRRCFLGYARIGRANIPDLSVNLPESLPDGFSHALLKFPD
jgi:hypothetical protein